MFREIVFVDGTGWYPADRYKLVYRASVIHSHIAKAYIAKSPQRQMVETNWILKSSLPHEPSSFLIALYFSNNDAVVAVTCEVDLFFLRTDYAMEICIIIFLTREDKMSFSVRAGSW